MNKIKVIKYFQTESVVKEIPSEHLSLAQDAGWELYDEPVQLPETMEQLEPLPETMETKEVIETSKRKYERKNG